ncbi:MAG: DUF2254 domain-containing protein [Bacillota bacterium]|nr:DUF2254 domain-containing protein [Bacillota bacterium]
MYPAIYSLASLALSLAISFVDQHYTDVIADHTSGLFFTNQALAQAVLGIIAGAFITIATFTFSTAMVVLTMYSSQFTPRVVENFLSNQTTMKSFGVFLSGFIFAITSMLLIKTRPSGDLVISASFGVLYVIVGLIYFLIFINSVSTQIQASGLIMRLHKEATVRIRQYCDFVERASVMTPEELQAKTSDQPTRDVYSLSDGYIQEINYIRLQHIAREHDCIICTNKVVGQFISSETRIISLYHKGEEKDQETLNEIQQCFLVGNKRTEEQDFSFTIQKIVEIALKALSPGINDPNTAIHCLNIIGLLLRDLADNPQGYIVLRSKDTENFVACEAYDFPILLYDAYQQISYYGQADAAVMIGLYKSLRFAKAKASPENLRGIDQYAEHLFAQVQRHGFDPLAAEKIAKEYIDLIEFRKEVDAAQAE